MAKRQTRKPQPFLDAKIYRVIDANTNRAKEAMRVTEDVARFVLDDKKLTARWKQCRHRLTHLLLRFPVSYRELVRSRDSAADIGSRSCIQDRPRRGLSVRDLVIANLKRSQEAMRVLEEFSKLVAPETSKGFQRLRFRLYELEKDSLPKL